VQFERGVRTLPARRHQRIAKREKLGHVVGGLPASEGDDVRQAPQGEVRARTCYLGRRPAHDEEPHVRTGISRMRDALEEQAESLIRSEVTGIDREWPTLRVPKAAQLSDHGGIRRARCAFLRAILDLGDRGGWRKLANGVAERGTDGERERRPAERGALECPHQLYQSRVADVAAVGELVRDGRIEIEDHRHLASSCQRECEEDRLLHCMCERKTIPEQQPRDEERERRVMYHLAPREADRYLADTGDGQRAMMADSGNAYRLSWGERRQMDPVARLSEHGCHLLHVHGGTAQREERLWRDQEDAGSGCAAPGHRRAVLRTRCPRVLRWGIRGCKRRFYPLMGPRGLR